jgi:hypothetical protein
MIENGKQELDSKKKKQLLEQRSGDDQIFVS